MDRADRALDKAWPARQGSEYISEMESAAEELQAIIKNMRLVNVGPVETSRTYRYLGSVYSDLAPALGDQLLATAISAYEQAEDELQGQDDVLERAKLDFNLANSLRQFYKNDARKLQEAERRLLAARSVFDAESPQHVAAVDEALSSTRSLISLAPMIVETEKNIQDVNELAVQLKSGRDVQEIAEKFGEIRERGGGAAGKYAKIQKLIEEFPESAKKGEKFDDLMKQMAGLTSAIQDMNSPTDPATQELLGLLRQRMEKEFAEGRVDDDRAAALTALVDELAGLLGGDDDIQSLMDRVGRLHSKAASQYEILHYMSHGIERPPEGSRAAELVELFWVLRLYLIQEMNTRGKSDGESKLALDLNMRAAAVDKRIYEVGHDDARAATVDNEALRPFAIETRAFAARHHPFLARPIWSVTAAKSSTNRVLFAGTDEGRDLVDQTCQKLSLKLLAAPKDRSFAASRFEQIQKAFVAVFDLRATNGTDRASVAYELGIARTLGKPVVILAHRDQRIPFDIDVDPLMLDGSGQDAEALYDAIDQASVWTMPRPRSAEDSVKATINEVLRQHPLPNSDVYVDQTLKQLQSWQDDPDSVAVNSALQTLLTFLDGPDQMLIHPVWPPVYGDPDSLRLFHVMPFRPDWADAAADHVEDACRTEGVEYIRGDRVSEQNIIQSIWRELATASHVLVDMTGFNENVALELGIAHTLGRPTAMVGQGDAVDNLFPMIAKLRFNPYGQPDDGKLASATKGLIRTDPTR
jgi:nucleoside 2-deoxyribosyltransferase